MAGIKQAPAKHRFKMRLLSLKIMKRRPMREMKWLRL
jgi:hypothetical protein